MFRSQGHTGLWDYFLTWTQHHIVSLSERRDDQHHFHFRKAVTNALPFPPTEREICKAIRRLLFGMKTRWVKGFRMRKEPGVTVNGMDGHKNVRPLFNRVST